MRALPRVTIVMTARERRAFTERAIDALVRHTGMAYRLIYADGRPPGWLKEVLLRRASEWGLEIVEFDAPLWPNQIRRRIAPSLETEYAVFIDNDVIVGPGWLEALVACADETEAGIVAPLYFESDGRLVTKIHMAGGRLRETRGADGGVLEESHQLEHAEPAEAADLGRQPCDFAEYHCMLIRTALAKDGSLHDDDIVGVHEHIDTALSVRKKGHPVYLEPSARVTCLLKAPFMLADLEFFRARWAPAAVEASIGAFCAKWNIMDDERSFGGARQYAKDRRIAFDPLRTDIPREALPRKPMQPHQLKQTPAGLVELLKERGYGEEGLLLIGRAYRAAMSFTAGLYRPGNRPFINHLAGTASVLLHYDFHLPVVIAGLLHAAYTHSGGDGQDPRAVVERVCEGLGGAGGPLERRVRAYTLRDDRWKELPASPAWRRELSLADSETLAILAANEVDMHLSGEFSYSGRRDVASAAIMELITHACGILGVPGLSETVAIEDRKLARIPVAERPRFQGSFRIVGKQAIPADNDWVRPLLRQQPLQ